MLVRPDGTRREIHSAFVQAMIDREEQRKTRHGWKDKSVGWSATAIPSEVEALRMTAAPRDGQRVTDFVDVTPIDADRMLYALRTEAFGGLFEYTISADEERRLAHKAEFAISEIDAHQVDGRLIASLAYADGTSNLATMRADGGRLSTITEGDSIDQAPRWARDRDDVIVYQSAGIARDHDGFLADVSPFRIEALELASQRHEVLAESHQHDLIMPFRLSDGALMYVRRPHEPQQRSPDAMTVVKDFVLFPARLASAVFWFLNSFSMVFNRKPLTSAGGPDQRGPTARQLVLYGRIIEMQKRGRRSDPQGAVVPGDWQLVRREPGGDERVLARGVGHYDVGDDGAVVYSNGQRVWRIDPQGKRTELAREQLVERVAALH